jgi:ferrous iron transport protein A
MISLCELKIGQQAKILEFIDSAMKCYSVRFGLEEGQVVTCIAKPGPVVIKKNHQEIAVGRNLSKNIYVNLV